MVHLRARHATIWDIHAEFSVSGSKSWHKRYKEPRWGINGMFVTLGNEELLGYAFNASTYIRLPLIKPKDSNYELGLRLGAGLSYLTKKFKVTDNYGNSAIGSHINGLMQAGLDNTFRFGRLRLIAGVYFTHMSNAAYKVPNLGLNYPSLGLGVNYQLRPSMEISDQEIPLPATPGKWIAEVTGAIGIKEIYPVLGPKYGIFSIYGLSGRVWNQHHSFLQGVDILYHAGARQELRNMEDADESFARAIRMGLSLGYGLHFGDFMLTFQMGSYIMNYKEIDGWIFHRIGARRAFGPWVAFMALKTHFFQADFVEAGVGYRFLK